jgi:cation transport ATPase
MGQACSCACKSARRQAWTIGVGLALALGAEIAEWLGLEGALPIALAGAAILLAGRGVLWQGLHALVRLRPNIYLLMTLASAGALALGKWGEAAVVLALYALAELLEQRASERSEQSLRAALQIAPAQATVQTPDRTWRTVPSSRFALGSACASSLASACPSMASLLQARRRLTSRRLQAKACPSRRRSAIRSMRGR